jgi:hypothetical protein
MYRTCGARLKKLSLPQVTTNTSAGVLLGRRALAADTMSMTFRAPHTCSKCAKGATALRHLAAAAVDDPVVAVEGQLIAQEVEQPRLGAVLLRPPGEALQPWDAPIVQCLQDATVMVWVLCTAI